MSQVSRRSFVSSLAALGLASQVGGASAWANDNAPRDVPWLAEVQTPPATLPADAKPLPSLLVDAAGKAISGLAAWQAQRQAIRKHWLEFLGPLTCARPSDKLEVLAEDRDAGVRRQLVRYECEPGLLVEGYLLQPLQTNGRVPGVVCLHSTQDFTIRQPAGLEGKPEVFFGLRLAKRGMAAFCPCCFLWQGAGTYQEQVARFERRHPGSKGMAKMLWDASRGLDVLAGLPNVDPARLGAVGHSLGAKEALYLAAFDERVKAAVSSEGGIGRSFSNWDAPWYLNKQSAGDEFKHDHEELLALVAPRAFLLVGGDSADGRQSWPYIEAALPVYRLHGKTARLGLLCHAAGHSVPLTAERRIDEWLACYL